MTGITTQDFRTQIVTRACDHHPKRGALYSNIGDRTAAPWYYCAECADLYLTALGKAIYSAA